MLIPLTLFAQDDPKPATEEGNDLDMNGVVALFKESETLEEFEEKLNIQENEVLSFTSMIIGFENPHH